MVVARACLLVLLFAASAQAAPITLGMWSPVPDDLPRDPILIGAGNLEYLHDGTGAAVLFGYENLPPVFRYTGDGELVLEGTTLYYIGPTGYPRLDSLSGALRLLHRDLAGAAQYWLVIPEQPGVLFTWVENFGPGFCEQDPLWCREVPEPGTLLLFGMGALSLAARWRRRA